MSTGQTHIPNPFTSGLPAGGIWRGESHRTIIALVVSGIVVFNAVGLLLVVRRFAGALSNDLTREAMLLTAVVATAVMACVRIAWRKQFPLAVEDVEDEAAAWQPYWDLLIGYGSSLSLFLLAIGCCFPADRTSDLLIWLPLLMADQFWRQSFFDAGNPKLECNESEVNLENEWALASLVGAENTETIAASRVDPLPFPPTGETEEIVQQLYRVRDEFGHEVIYGTLRADFLAGQRTAVVHAGFCPPLSHLPEIEAETFRGPTARIKVVQALAHGTRMDIRLTAPATADCHVWIDMAAMPATPQEKIAS